MVSLQNHINPLVLVRSRQKTIFATLRNHSLSPFLGQNLINPDKLWDFQTFIQTFKDLTINIFNGNDHVKTIFNGLSVDRQTNDEIFRLIYLKLSHFFSEISMTGCPSDLPAD